MAAGATYEPIATQTLASPASTITFSSIAASWTDIKLVIVAKCTTTGATINLTFNNDTATNYSYTFLTGNGSTASSVNNINQNFINIGNVYTTQWTLGNIDIFSYAGSTNKSILSLGAIDRSTAGVIYSITGTWRSTSAINRVDIAHQTGDTFVVGTTATLYGIKAA